MEFISLNQTEDIFGITENIFNESGDNETVAVYGKPDFISELFVLFIKSDYIFKYADFDNLDAYLKDCVYCLSVNKDKGVWVNKAYSDGTLLETDASVVLVNLNDTGVDIGQNIIDCYEYNEAKIVAFDFECFEDLINE